VNAFRIRPACSAADLAAVAALFEGYAASLPVDLGYQDFAAELAGLPGKYAPPHGALLLASDEAGAPLGCVALRPLPPHGRCEMKRLFLTPAARGARTPDATAPAHAQDPRPQPSLVSRNVEGMGRRCARQAHLSTLTELSHICAKPSRTK